jgi:hypothetical protein
MLGTLIEHIFDSHAYGKFMRSEKCSHPSTNYMVFKVRRISVPLTNHLLMWIIDRVPEDIKQILVWAFYFFFRLQFLDFSTIKEYCKQNFRHEAVELTYKCTICAMKGSNKFHSVIVEKTCSLNGIIRMQYGSYNNISCVHQTIEVTHHGANLLSSLERINGMHHTYCFLTSNCQHFARIMLIIIEEREHSGSGDNITRDLLNELPQCKLD